MSVSSLHVMPVARDPDRTDEVTIGELYRRQVLEEQRTQRSFQALDDRVSTTLVNREYFLARHEALEGRVTVIEKRWEDSRLFRQAIAIASISALVSSAVAVIATLVH